MRSSVSPAQASEPVRWAEESAPDAAPPTPPDEKFAILAEGLLLILVGAALLYACAPGR